ELATEPHGVLAQDLDGAADELQRVVALGQDQPHAQRPLPDEDPADEQLDRQLEGIALRDVGGRADRRRDEDAHEPVDAQALDRDRLFGLLDRPADRDRILGAVDERVLVSERVEKTGPFCLEHERGLYSGGRSTPRARGRSCRPCLTWYAPCGAELPPRSS